MADLDAIAAAISSSAEDNDIDVDNLAGLGDTEEEDVQPEEDEGQGAETPDADDEEDAESSTDEDDESDTDGSTDDDDEDKSEEVDEDSVPTEYMGVDLSGFPAAKRQELIDAMRKSDSYANKVQQEKAELEKRLAAIEEKVNSTEDADEPEFELPSDEEIAKALGLDPEDPLYEVKAEASLPVAKEVVRLAQTVQALVAAQEEQQLLANLALQVDSIATDNQLSEDDVNSFLDFVVEKEEQDLQKAFEAWSTPRREALTAAQKAQQEAEEAERKAKELLDKKRKAKTRRPSAPKTTPSTPESVEDVIRGVAREHGITF